jgi:MoxR-like ATPase
VLADEINRASPKTQSALLEVMEEGHVTVDGVTHDVPQPFMVIATQNPIEQAGTYRLPEAQLDRFLMKTSVGYPDAEATEELLLNSRVRDRAALVEPIMKIGLVTEMRHIADEVHVDRSVVTYVRQLAEASRDMEHVRLGLSPRGCLALIRVIKTWAVADGREYVVPEDVAALAHAVLGHRLILDGEAQFRGVEVTQVIDELLDRVRVPSLRA